ncbi:hypothetical protein LSTR_LSTR003386 [Laodelphax striatellus]|uniref:Uncharacterized protein n=1 Tax=Laodelphax striatellus TaxID=195883 RepID=A0A482X5I6_LAOST|nr:hypothetical protein LSTR_LSTR003386 [Laodelphax striatellus]
MTQMASNFDVPATTGILGFSTEDKSKRINSFACYLIIRKATLDHVTSSGGQAGARACVRGDVCCYDGRPRGRDAVQWRGKSGADGGGKFPDTEERAEDSIRQLVP